MLAVLLAACGGGGSSAPADPDGRPASATFLLDYLYDWYYWLDELPSRPPADAYPDASSALVALKVPRDRYSYIEPAASYDAFFDEGRSLGFGITYQVEADALALRLVQPLSPAYAAGLRRGDRIVAIGGQSVSQLLATDSLGEAFGPEEAGTSREFTIHRDGRLTRLTATRDWYDLSYVIAPSLHRAGGRRVGYLSFQSFGRLGVPAWRAAIDELLAAGAQDLVVDLRENGGGLVAVAAEIGASLGQEDLGGRTMSRLEFNHRHASSNREFSFGSADRGQHFDRIVWLVSSRSCSATEMLIIGLDPWRPAGSTARIGTRTCGKPVGFTPPTHDGWVYSIVSFATRNALDDGDYYDGLVPDCTVGDPVVGELGSTSEPLLGAALEWLASGQCPASATGKALAAPVRRDTSLHGLATLTGLR